MYTTTCHMNIDIDMLPEYEYLNLYCPNKCNKLSYKYNNKNNYDGLFLEGKFMSRPARGGGGEIHLGPGLVSGTKVLVKCLVMGATVKMVGGP